MTRIVAPGHVVQAGRAQSLPETAALVLVRADLPPGPPNGYRHAFDDGRLNPYRGERTAAGRAQMQRIWTDDVPARLVEEQQKKKR